MILARFDDDYARDSLRLSTFHGEHTIIVMTTFDPDIGKARRWPKGVSGNPGGRPKSRLLSQALTARLGELAPGDSAGRTVAEILADNLITLACSQERNSVAAAAEIANRVEGRVHERIEFTDLTEQLSTRTDDDLKYFLTNDCWPESDDVLGTEQSLGERERVEP